MSSNDLRSSLRSIRQSLCGLIADTLLVLAFRWYVWSGDEKYARLTLKLVELRGIDAEGEILARKIRESWNE